jgi:hypothetical protein
VLGGGVTGGTETGVGAAGSWARGVHGAFGVVLSGGSDALGVRVLDGDDWRGTNGAGGAGLGAGGGENVSWPNAGAARGGVTR